MAISVVHIPLQEGSIPMDCRARGYRVFDAFFQLQLEIMAIIRMGYRTIKCDLQIYKME
jgi:hypothetical protein